MPDIFDEVEQDLRADRAQVLLRRYGPMLIGAAAAVVLAVAAWQVWVWWDGRQTARVANDYIAAMRTADLPGAPDRAAASAAFAGVAREGDSGYRALSLLRQAGLAADAGDTAGAIALWDQVAGDGHIDKLFRDLAALRAATHQIDTGDPGQVAARLAALTAPDNPFHALAAEGQALLAIRQGKTDAARDTLRQLAQDPTATEGVRQRAAGLLQRLGG